MSEIALLCSTSIVFLGHLNPAIIHPQWFERYKILPIQETQKASGEKPRVIEVPGEKIILEESPLTSVTASRAYIPFPSLTIDVTLDKYVCSAVKSECFPLVKDVTEKTFNILEHTPITSVGINTEGHWKCKESAHNILKRLFANDDNSFRSRFGEEYRIGGIITFKKDNKQVSLRINGSTTLNDGVHFNFNFHYVIESQQAKSGVDVIKDNYDKDIDESISIAKELIGAPENTWKLKS